MYAGGFIESNVHCYLFTANLLYGLCKYILIEMPKFSW